MKRSLYSIFLVFSIIFIGLSLTFLYIRSSSNQELNYITTILEIVLIIGLLLLAWVHFGLMQLIYKLTKTGLESLSQIIAALLIAFSLFLFIPELVILYNIKGTYHMFSIEVEWISIFVINILQIILVSYTMITLRKKTQIT